MNISEENITLSKLELAKLVSSCAASVVDVTFAKMKATVKYQYERVF